MSGTPPFCTSGNKFFYDDFNSLEADWWDYNGAFVQDGLLKAANDQITVNSKIIPGNPTGSQSITISARYNLADMVLNQRGVYIGARINSNMFLFGIYSGLMAMPYANGQYLSFYGGTGNGTFTPELNNSITGELSLTAYVDHIDYYYNGTYKHTISGAPELNVIDCIQVLVSDITGGVKMFLEDFTIDAPDITGGTLCQGIIPSAHREIVSSTAKISHSRILQEERNLLGAQNFHNLMKGLT